MITEREFISKVRAHWALYCYAVKSNDIEHERNQEWEQLALECNIENGARAKAMWQTLVKKYLNFLRNGDDFEYFKEMRYFQPFLFGDSESDSELDENVLNRILCDDDDDDATKVQLPLRSKEFPTKPTKRKLSSEQNKSVHIPAMKKPKDNRNLSTPTCSINNLTPLELIFLGYAKLLQNLPPLLQLKTKRKIADIMSETELELLKQSENSEF